MRVRSFTVRPRRIVPELAGDPPLALAALARGDRDDPVRGLVAPLDRRVGRVDADGPSTAEPA